MQKLSLKSGMSVISDVGVISVEYGNNNYTRVQCRFMYVWDCFAYISIINRVHVPYPRENMPIPSFASKFCTRVFWLEYTPTQNEEFE